VTGLCLEGTRPINSARALGAQVPHAPGRDDRSPVNPFELRNMRNRKPFPLRNLDAVSSRSKTMGLGDVSPSKGEPWP